MISAKERTVAKGITASGVGMGESWPRMQSAATVCAPSDKICHHLRVYPKERFLLQSHGWQHFALLLLCIVCFCLLYFDLSCSDLLCLHCFAQQLLKEALFVVHAEV